MKELAMCLFALWLLLVATLICISFPGSRVAEVVAMLFVMCGGIFGTYVEMEF